LYEEVIYVNSLKYSRFEFIFITLIHVINKCYINDIDKLNG
jgi:hypothetical protein